MEPIEFPGTTIIVTKDKSAASLFPYHPVKQTELKLFAIYGAYQGILISTSKIRMGNISNY